MHCLNCGKDITVGRRYCKGCGSGLLQLDAKDSPRWNPGGYIRKKRLLFLSLFIGGTLIAVLSVLMIMLGR